MRFAFPPSWVRVVGSGNALVLIFMGYGWLGDGSPQDRGEKD